MQLRWLKATVLSIWAAGCGVSSAELPEPSPVFASGAELPAKADGVCSNPADCAVPPAVAGSSDPFDPTSCQGVAFPSGATETLGTFPVYSRSHFCSYGGDCQPWSAPVIQSEGENPQTLVTVDALLDELHLSNTYSISNWRSSSAYSSATCTFTTTGAVQCGAGAVNQLSFLPSGVTFTGFAANHCIQLQTLWVGNRGSLGYHEYESAILAQFSVVHP